MERNAHVALLQLLQIPRDAVLTEHGEPFYCESDGRHTMRFKAPGIEGEYRLEVKLEHRPPYRRQP